MTRLLIADDHSMFRLGLRRLLADFRELEIIGECASGHEALEAIRSLRPDVALIDISMPDLDGVTLVSTLRNEQNMIPIVMLTMHDEPHWCRRALAAGANGYLLKDDAFNELLMAITAVTVGNRFISSRLNVECVKEETRTEHLTGRELEVLRLIIKGMTNRMIAVTLQLSIKTVDTHRTKIMKKLDLHNSAELVRYAVENRLV